MALGKWWSWSFGCCLMDSLATTGYPGFGNGLRYRYGLFKQRIVDGYQVELPDGWFGSQVMFGKHVKTTILSM